MTPTVCMVCSAARSGSTMLDLTLGGHSQIASLGEFSFLGKAISLRQSCTCGEVITECPSWQKVFQHILSARQLDLTQDPYALEQWFARASTVVDHAHQTKSYELKAKLATALCDLRYRKPNRPRAGLLTRLKRGRENALYLYEAIASQWPEQVLVDSSKNVHKALALYEAAPAQIRVIYLIRDGRGVYYSRRSSGFSQSEAISGWRNYNKRASELLSRNLSSEHFLEIRYEEMMANPESTLEQACEMLGLEFEPSMTTIRPASSHLVNGNDMRFKGTQPLKLDERWKTELAKEELAWFNNNDGGLNHRLGYR